MKKTTTKNQFSQKLKPKLLYRWSFLLVSLFLGSVLHAQVDGSTCEAPLVVDEMPFSDMGNTSTYGNNYGISDLPSLASDAITTGTGSEYYLSGDDVVYSYTPGDSGSISINTTNNNDWIGLWVFTGCPFESTVGYHTSIDGATRSITDLPVVGGEEYYIVISDWSTSTDYTINITGTDIGDPPTCLKPKNLALSSFSANDAEIEWTAGEDETEWEVLFGEAGFDVETEGESFSVNDDLTFQLTDLTQNTNYHAYVKAICAEDDVSSLAGPLSFTTSCTAIDTPFTQDFEDVVVPDIPNCGSLEVNNGKAWKTISTTSYGFNGKVLIYGYHTSSGDADSWYFTQGINLEADLNYRISYQYGNNGASYTEKLKVAYGSSASSSTMTEELADHQINLNGSDTNEITFSPDSDGVYYFGFQSHSATNQLNLYLDNIEIIEFGDCADATAGTISTEDMNICAGEPFTLEVEGDSEDTVGLTKQWMSSTDGDTWEPIEGATNPSYTLSEGILEETQFKYVVSCAQDDSTDETAAITVSMNPGDECYCIPGGTNSSYYINNFSTTNGLENIENLESGYSEDGYGDFTETHTVSQVHTESIDFEADYEGGTYGTKIWVDWNQDGLFGEDEIVYQTSSYSSSESGSFEVPESATLGTTRMRIGISYTPSSGPNDPCEVGSREFEDYSFEVLPLEDCEGTPTAGTVETEMNVCAGVAFTLASEGATNPAGGLERTWQSSPAGEDDWSNIEDSNTANFILQDGIAEPTDFRYSVTCTLSDEGDVSEVIAVTLNPAIECYCIPGGTNSSYYINNFSTTNGQENIENLESGYSDDGYGDFTETHTVSQAHTESIDFAADYVGTTFGTKIWVDWNQDGMFDEDEIVYQSSSYASSTSGSIEVPESATLGATRMRIGISSTPSTGPNDPCEEGTREFEDYTFEVLALEACTGTPTAGTVETELNVCAGVAFTLFSEGATQPADGLERIWQSSPAGEDDWTDIEGSNSANYILEDGVSEPTDFRYSVTCIFSDESDISEVMEVSIKPADECYCTPEGTNSSRFINNFSTTDAVDNVTNMNSGFSPGGYGDFTDMIISQENTQDISFDVDIEGGTAGFRIWIDWNRDGQFSADEVVYQSNGYGASHSGSFTVPEDVELGETVMRIVSHWLNTSGDIDPCETGFSYGEFEDYTFEVIELEDCEGMPSAGTPDEDSLNVCAGIPFTVSVSDASGAANNLYRRWQSSPAGEDDWTDIEGSGASSFVVPDGVNEPTDFRYVQTCNEEDTDVSDIIEVTLKPAIECYCIPENNSSSSYYISNASTDGALQDIDNDTEFSDNGYGDYSESHVIIAYPGQEFDYSITGNNSSMYYGIWLDIDQNGNFDGPLEHIASSEGYTTAPFTGSFEVPADFEEGSYRLRVRSNQFGGALGPCEDNTNGETEDYTLQVIFPDCFPPVNISVNYITDVSAQVNWDANDEDSWVVIYGEEGFDPEEEEENVIEVEDIPSADLTDLDDDTTYEVYVKTICGEDESILIGPIKFTTNITPPENTRLCDAIPLEPNSGCIGGPYTNVAAFEEAGEPIGTCHNDYRGKNTVWFTFIASGDGEAVITTDFNSTEILTEIVVFEAPTDCEDMTTLGEEVGCADASDEGILELEGLTPGETYYVKVGGFNNTAGLFCIEVQLEEVPVCFAPTEINIGEISDETVEVSWTAGGDETQWEVIYGEAGFNPETTGQSEIVNTTEVTLTDLTPETDYDVYVRAICTQLNSDLAGPELFTTEPMSVDSQVFANFTFYPNPVKDQLTLKAGTQIENVEVYNLLGQNVISAKPNSLEAQINTEALQSGVYLMEVNINGSQKTFRVVKK